MSAIANQWTGDGLADGTSLSSNAIVQTAGNYTGSGVTWTRAGSAPTFRTAGHGFETLGAAADIGRIDATITTPQSAVRTQIKVTRGPTATSEQTPIDIRNATASMARILLSIDTDRTIWAVITNTGTFVTGSTAPAVAVGDVLLIDYVAALHSSPTTSNGRIFFRIKNTTNTAWNTTGEFFFDSGYTLNLGTTNPSIGRFGKTGGGLLTTTPSVFEYVGIEPITVAITDTSVAAAKAYFADTPVTAVPLATPVVTVNSVSHPTSSGASDGSITISWGAVSGADHYEVGIAAGDVTTGYTTVNANATSPYTITGRTAGVYTVAVKAKAA